MKLKHVVVAAISASLMTIPAFSAAATHHHKHHHKLKHNTENVNQEYHGYKGEELPAAIVVPDWVYKISIDGGLNFDSHWGNRNIGYMGENSTRLSVNDLYLNFNANVNDWVKAFASLTYDNTSNIIPTPLPATAGASPLLLTQPSKSGSYETSKNSNGANIDQAFIKIGNMEELPVYAKLGKQYADFGSYTIHPIERTMAQVLSETLRTAATVGFSLPMMGIPGLHASVYTFEDAMGHDGKNHRSPDYGVSIGVGQPNEQLGWDVGADYLYSMTGVNDIGAAVGINNQTNHSGGVNGGAKVEGGSYINRVGGIAIHGNVNSGPFSLLLHYVQSLQHFSPVDLARSTANNASGASPWAADAQAAFGFNYWEKNQTLYLGYQASGDSVEMFLPQSRWLAGYDVNAWKNTNVGLEIGHDIDYGVSKGGTGNSSNTVALRVGVKIG